MISEILEIVKLWHFVVQFLFFSLVVLSIGAVLIAIAGYISDFFNGTLVVLLRGYPQTNDENKRKEDDENSTN